jgi:hypothetical protein
VSVIRWFLKLSALSIDIIVDNGHLNTHTHKLATTATLAIPTVPPASVPTSPRWTASISAHPRRDVIVRDIGANRRVLGTKANCDTVDTNLVNRGARKRPNLLRGEQRRTAKGHGDVSRRSAVLGGSPLCSA